MSIVSPTAAATPKGQARREAILDAACALFAKQGYDAVTTKELAAAVGCSEALLFRYFSSKEAIYEALYEEYFEIVVKPYELPRIEGETGRNWLYRLWQDPGQYKKSLARKGLGTAVQTRIQKKEQLEKLRREQSDIVENLLIPMFQYGQADGSLPVKDPGKAAYIFWLIVSAIASRKTDYPHQFNPEVTFDEVLMSVLCY